MNLRLGRLRQLGYALDSRRQAAEDRAWEIAQRSGGGKGGGGGGGAGSLAVQILEDKPSAPGAAPIRSGALLMTCQAEAKRRVEDEEHDMMDDDGGDDEAGEGGASGGGGAGLLGGAGPGDTGGWTTPWTCVRPRMQAGGEVWADDTVRLCRLNR